MIPASVVDKQRAAEEKQRYLERKIRYEKERASILSAVDPEEAKKSRARAAALARYYKAFSERHTLSQSPDRIRTLAGEKIYERNATAKDRKKYGI